MRKKSKKLRVFVSIFMAVIMLFASFAFSACDFNDFLGTGNKDNTEQTNPPEDGKNDPEDGKNDPEDGKNDPEDGKNDPEDGKNDPEDGKNDPEDGKNDPEDGKNDPDDGKNDPDDEKKVYSLSFASVANRELQNASTQVWKQNGITLTNNKTGSSTAIADYVNPVRLYKNSTIKVEYNGIEIIIFHAHTGYGEDLETSLNNASLSGATISRSENDVTVAFEPAVTEVEFTASAQIRLDSLDVISSGSLDPDDGKNDPDDGKSDQSGDVSELSIHFLELGNKYAGDCTLIKIGDTEILIDAGSRDSSAATIVPYIQKYCTDGVLEYVIVTHAHQDHIAAFVGTTKAPGVFDSFECGTIIDFARTDATSNIYKNYVAKRDAEVAAGAKHYTALECTRGINGAQTTYELGENVSMTILYQKYYEQKSSDENNYSVCVLLTQGEYNYLFTGDLEKEGEESLVASNPDLPHCKLFKGGHHGSKTSSNEVLLEKITPENVCICCCAGSPEYTTNLDNMFPTQDMINRVAKYTKNIYVTSLATDVVLSPISYGYTSMNGNIVVWSNGKDFTVTGSNNSTILKDTEWFKANRTWPSYGVQ